MLKTRHSSLDIADGDSAAKKHKHVMLTKARNKLMNFGDALRTSKTLNADVDHGKKSMAQSTLDYFFKVPYNSSTPDFENCFVSDITDDQK